MVAERPKAHFVLTEDERSHLQCIACLRPRLPRWCAGPRVPRRVRRMHPMRTLRNASETPTRRQANGVGPSSSSGPAAVL